MISELSERESGIGRISQPCPSVISPVVPVHDDDGFPVTVEPTVDGTIQEVRPTTHHVDPLSQLRLTYLVQKARIEGRVCAALDVNLQRNQGYRSLE